MPVCAGPSEPCYLDPICLTPHLDDLGGLGCNAGGKGQECRFCGFGPFPACPGPPRAIVVLTAVVAGTVETFDEESYKAGLLSALPSEVGDVDIILNVTAASVKVEATLLVLVSEESTESATLVAETLGSMSPAELSSALGVEVAEVEEVAPPVVFKAEKAEILINDSGLTAAGGGGGAMAAAGCVAVVVTALLVWYVRRRRRAQNPARGAVPTGKERRRSSSGPKGAEAADIFPSPEDQRSASSRRGLGASRGVSFAPTFKEPTQSLDDVDSAARITDETSRHTKLRQSFAGRGPRTGCLSSSLSSQRLQRSQRSLNSSCGCEETSAAESSTMRTPRRMQSFARGEESFARMASSRRSHLGDHGDEEWSSVSSRRKSHLGEHSSNEEASSRAPSLRRKELLERSISGRRERLALGLTSTASVEGSTSLRLESSQRQPRCVVASTDREAPPTQRRILGNKEAPPTSRSVRRLDPSCSQAAAVPSASGNADPVIAQSFSPASTSPQGQCAAGTPFDAAASPKDMVKPSPLPAPTSAAVTRWQKALQAKAVCAAWSGGDGRASVAPARLPPPLESSPAVAMAAASPAQQRRQSAELVAQRLSRFGPSEADIFDSSYHPERNFDDSYDSERRPSQTRRASRLNWEAPNAPTEASPAVRRLSRVYQSGGGGGVPRALTPQAERERPPSPPDTLSRCSSTGGTGSPPWDSGRRRSSLGLGPPLAASESPLVGAMRRGSRGGQDGTPPPQPPRRSSTASSGANARRMSVRI
jgi:hypothetical protein